jgi:hypothetical protein
MSRASNFKRANEKKRAEKARQRQLARQRERQQQVIARTAANLEALRERAALVLKLDGQLHSGLELTEQGWQYINCDGEMEPEEPCADPAEAALGFYADVYVANRPWPSFAGNPSATSKHISIERRDETAEHLLLEARIKLGELFRTGQLDEDDEELFYEFFADADARQELKKKWDAESA